MKDEELLRYHRHIVLPGFEVEGQEKLQSATVLVIGLGGLGCPAAMYLAASGIGHLILVDNDQVDLTNLQRQIAHNTARIGMDKTTSAAESLRQLNPNIKITALQEKVQETNIQDLLIKTDVVLDCSDNFSTRFLINRYCVKFKKVLVSGAAIGLSGQIVVFRLDRDDSPCYHCLYPDANDEILSCAENGVLAPIVGVIGSMQAVECLKCLLDLGEDLHARLLNYDGLKSCWRESHIKKDLSCNHCCCPGVDKS